MLLALAIADAYGAGFEYADPTPDRPNDLTHYVRHPKHHGITPGMTTDDTQMSLANAECVLQGHFARDDFAKAYVLAFKRDPRDGYARGFQAFLESVSDAEDFLTRIKPDSDKSGAAMRASPIGLLRDLNEVLRVSALQARLTHDTPGGVAAAQGAALMVHHQAYKLGPIADLPEFLAGHVPFLDWRNPHRTRARITGDDIARAALGILLDSRSLSDVLQKTVILGGDTDTVAAIAMAAAAVSAELERDIPATLIHTLENGPYGREFLKSVDQRLADHFLLPILKAPVG